VSGPEPYFEGGRWHVPVTDAMIERAWDAIREDREWISQVPHETVRAALEAALGTQP
jgi:hypothetical protein